MDPVQSTREWLERVVVGLKLCPFAAAPLREGLVRILGSRAESDEEVLAELLVEARALSTREGTTLLVVPDRLADFEDFLDLLAAAEDLLGLEGLEGVIQLAAFHPDWRFEGAPPDDPADWTNRSPFPTLHLLRWEEVDRAVRSHPDTESIPARNQALLRGMSVEQRQALFGE